MNTSIEISASRSGLKIAGRFDFHAHQAFVNASRKLLTDRQAGEVVIEMDAVTYLDSSALGMLLVLRDEARRHGVSVALGHCPPPIQRILRMAHFDRLFAHPAG